MTQPATSPWDRLAPPPRDVPFGVRFRVRAAEFRKLMNIKSSMAGHFIIFLLFFGTVATGLGAAHIAAGPDPTDSAVEKKLPMFFTILGALCLIGSLAWMISAVVVRSQRKLQLLRSGRVAPATCTKIWDQQRIDWAPFDKVAARWRDFSATVQRRYGSLMSKIAAQGQHWPCKILVADGAGKQHEITMRMSVDDVVKNPDLLVLCDPPNVNDAIRLDEFYRNIIVSPTGHWEVAP